MYRRFCDLDQFVVPYHPAVLLAWGAHTNVQRVTDAAWSYYVLKYAAKEALPTNITLDGNALHALGLDGISEQQAKLAAAVVLSRPVCPCEAALIASGQDIIECSDDVTFVDTRPPSLESWNPSSKGSGPLATYLARPSGPEFDDLTLPEYFKQYEVGDLLLSSSATSAAAGCVQPWLVVMRDVGLTVAVTAAVFAAACRSAGAPTQPSPTTQPAAPSP